MVNLEISDRDDEYYWAAHLNGNLFVCDECGNSLDNTDFEAETGDECTYERFGEFARSRGWFVSVRNVGDNFDMDILCLPCTRERLRDVHS